MSVAEYTVTQHPGCNENDCGNSVYGWIFLQEDHWSKGLLGPMCHYCYEQNIDDKEYNSFIAPNDPSVEWELRDDGIMYPKGYICMIFERKMFSR